MRALLLLFFCWNLLHAENTLSGDAAAQGSDLTTIFAEPSEQFTVSPPSIEQQRHIYTTITHQPKQLIVGEIFPVTLRTIVTVPDVTALVYRYAHGRDVEPLSAFADANVTGGRVYFHTLYFKATGSDVRIPSIVPTISRDFMDQNESVTVLTSPVDTTRLNPPPDFCGIVADRFDISAVKSTVYDPEHTITVFSADANRSDLGDFYIPAAEKQGFEFLENTPHASHMSYFAVLPATMRVLQLSYFNLTTRRYAHVRLTVIPEDDSVSTMSDLAPKAHGHLQVKTAISLIAGILFLTLFYYKRAKTWLLFALLSFALAAWLGAPIRHACLKKDSEIYLLPMKNATVFEHTKSRERFEVAGGIEGYTKIRLPDNKIGWIKDEDLCSP